MRVRWPLPGGLVPLGRTSEGDSSPESPDRVRPGRTPEREVPTLWTMGGRTRVYELARELGLTNRETLDICMTLGVGVRSHSSSIEESDADRVRHDARKEPGSARLNRATPQPRLRLQNTTVAEPVLLTEPSQPRSPTFDDTFMHAAEELYSNLKASRFEHALRQLRLALDDLIATEFDPTARLRVRVGEGRIKQFNRLISKARSDDYCGKISTAADVFQEISDIVGIRITCNVVQDVDRVRDAILAIEGRQDAPNENPTFRVAPLPVRDYVTTPKPSGYRAVHLFVDICVPSGGTMVPVLCEIQISFSARSAGDACA